MSFADPDARPIRKGKLGKPNEFGYVASLAEITENTQRGARGLILPAARPRSGTRREDTLLPDTIAELSGSGSGRARSRSTAGSTSARPRQALERSRAQSGCSSPAANNPAPNAPSAGCSATGPAPKDGSVTSNAATGWTDPGSKATKASRSGPDGAILAYNADTLAIRTR